MYHPRVTQIDDAGFTVTWDVGLDAVRAEFPVWIEYDSTDVLTKGTSEVTSDTISYHVNLSDHGGKTVCIQYRLMCIMRQENQRYARLKY